MQLSASNRELVLKLVYYGPPLSGKTTNLKALHQQLDPSARGKLESFDTADDRTLFFDVMPLRIQTRHHLSLRFKIYTVPGQRVHASTRKMVLQGADGVVFVADSQLSQARLNNEYWHGMRRYLQENHLDYSTLPMVLQFNKRDLPNIRSDAELVQLGRKSRAPIIPATALEGEGVVETLTCLLGQVFSGLEQNSTLKEHYALRADELLKDFRSFIVSEEGDSQRDAG